MEIKLSGKSIKGKRIKKTISTKSNGGYILRELPKGTYLIEAVKPSGSEYCNKKVKLSGEGLSFVGSDTSKAEVAFDGSEKTFASRRQLLKVAITQNW